MRVTLLPISKEIEILSGYVVIGGSPIFSIVIIYITFNG